MASFVFTVIIPTYNRAELLRNALDSVFAQTFDGYEMIVVDDGSTDETESVVSKYGSKIQFLRQANRGPGAARNHGARQAKGEYLAFLDSDDLWFPWSLDCYRHVIERYQRPAFIAGKPFRFSREEELRGVKPGDLQASSFSDYLASADEWRWWGASSFVVRRDAFESADGFVEEWINGEDADLALRLGTAPGFVQVTGPFTFGYREHEVSAMKNLDRTLAGVRHAIRSENGGRYPGGPQRALERWQILTRQVRPVALECLQRGMRREAWDLYRDTFRWHLRLGRWKFVMGFALKAALRR